MAVHYFHCTDGVDLIVDRDGREASSPQELARLARGAAERVMRAVPSYDAWENWSVYVYGARGQVAIIPFMSGHDEQSFLDQAFAEPAAPMQPALPRANPALAATAG
jgi:hypothetical protein